jgi:hypothetical protein
LYDGIAVVTPPILPVHQTRQRDSATTHRIYVTEPRDGWCTRGELIDWGYSDAGIDRFFGPETEGPDGITCWMCEHIDHIEETVVVPALRVVEDAFSDPETPVSILRAAST